MRVRFLVISLLFWFAPLPSFAATLVGSQWQDGVVTPFPFSVPFDVVGDIASEDIGIDGIPEIVMSAGARARPWVSVLRQDGSEIFSFLAYPEPQTHGVTVAVGDVNGDDVAEIVTGTMYGGEPLVRVFDAKGTLQNEFTAYAPTFHGGVNVALGDINGDGTRDIVTAPGLTGGPHIRVFDGNGSLLTETFVFDVNDRAGVDIAVIHPKNNERATLVVSHYGVSTPETRLVTFDETLHASLSVPSSAYASTFPYGVSVFSVSDTLYGTTPNGNGGPHVRLFSIDSTPNTQWFSDDERVRDRIIATAVAPNHIVTVRTEPLLIPRLDKHIVVDLSTQHLYAYDQGVSLIDFLISSGKKPFVTPKGTFSVTRKLPWHDYVWTYGANDPRNYELRDVEFNLEFKKHFYIHYAYWHNNFGRPMSHGCVNAPYDGVK
ncbi:L,D-transpeptidase family protein, partial [Candidatus Uhrbacteria bacterium]|nr:L,D-transpeptidase family protein [Candidatus Uhrbacteria bacterium]